MCGGKTKKTTQTQTQAPAPEAMEYYKLLMKKLKQMDKLKYEPYKGQRVAGFTPDQLEAMQGVRGLQGAGMGTLQEAIEAGRRGAAPITSEDIQRYQDPYQKMVLDAMNAQMRQQEAEDISRLQGQSVSAGAFGGDRAKMAQAQMMRNQAQERNMRMSELMSKGYSQALAAAQVDREAASRGAGQLSEFASQEYSLPASQLQALYGMGTAQQALRQQKLEVPYETYLERRAFPYQQLQYLSGIGTGVGSQMGGTSTGVTKQPGPSIFSQLLGAGLSLGMAPVTGGGSLMGNFFAGSDERFKENIEDVGTTNDGQTIYKYNYKGDPRTHLGLIAQEVEQHHPEAVRENTAGFKFVNYDLATKDAVHKAEGGGLGTTGMFQKGFIPGIDPVKGQGAPGFVSAPAPEEDRTLDDVIDKAVSLSQKIRDARDPENPASWKTTTTLSPENPAAWSPTTMAAASPTSWTLSPYQSYAAGGEVGPPKSITDWSAIAQKILDEKNKTGEVPPGISVSSTGSIMPPEEERLPVESFLGTPTTEALESKLPTIDVNMKKDGKPSDLVSPSGKDSDGSGGIKGSSLLGGMLGLSPEAEQAGFAAGLAMMAGESPFALSNIGEGGLAGMKYYNELMKSKQEKELKEKELELKGTKPPKKSGMVTSDGKLIYLNDNGDPVFLDGTPVPPDADTMPESYYKEMKKGETKGKVEKQKARSAYRSFHQGVDIMEKKLYQVANALSPWSTGFASKFLKDIPETEANVIKNYLNTLKIQIGLTKLQDFKRMSTTGASGFGALTEGEFNRLMESQAALNQDLPIGRLIEELNNVSEIVKGMKSNYDEEFEDIYGPDSKPTLKSFSSSAEDFMKEARSRAEEGSPPTMTASPASSEEVTTHPNYRGSDVIMREGHSYRWNPRTNTYE